MTGHDESVRLRVGDAKLEDVAEGRARLSADVFRTLHLKQGDMVQVAGKSRILAAALPTGPEDEGLDLIRLDGTQRVKLGVNVGEMVEVRRFDARAAQRVRLVALGSRRALEFAPHEIRATLAGKSVLVGDTFAVAPERRDFQAEVSVLGLRLVEFTGSSAGPNAVLVRVVETSPPGVVRVTDDTEIEIISADETGEPDGHELHEHELDEPA
jgi:transitional endoplasmic reticulum ATPase